MKINYLKGTLEKSEKNKKENSGKEETTSTNKKKVAPSPVHIGAQRKGGS